MCASENLDQIEQFVAPEDKLGWGFRVVAVVTRSTYLRVWRIGPALLALRCRRGRWLVLVGRREISSLCDTGRRLQGLTPASESAAASARVGKETRRAETEKRVECWAECHTCAPFHASARLTRSGEILCCRRLGSSLQALQLNGFPLASATTKVAVANKSVALFRCITGKRIVDTC